MFSPDAIKKDFPLLQKKVHGKPLVYLDNAATSQKPQQVIEAIVNYYQNHNANVHRGVHQLSEESTQVFEDSRKIIAQFFGANDEELILVRNTTEAINGIAYGWALDHLKKGDVILTTEMEHHSNIVPWQEICTRTGAQLKFIPVKIDGRLDLENFKFLISNFKTKLLVLTHVSNTLGTVNPIEKIVSVVNQQLTTDHRPLILLDAAQSAPHMQLDFHKLGVDFLIFSGHKMLGPMGVGGLLVKKTLLSSNEVKPWLFGGGMIESVYMDRATFHEDAQERFTAGTPDVASAVGLAEACRYLDRLGMKDVEEHDRRLVTYALDQLQQIPEVTVVGPIEAPHLSDSRSNFSPKREKTDTDNLQPTTYSLDRLGSVAFLYEGVHPHDVAQILDSEGIAVRSGHHCTMPLHVKFGWPGTVRVSFQVYNSKKDVDALVRALHKVKTVFGR